MDWSQHAYLVFAIALHYICNAMLTLDTLARTKLQKDETDFLQFTHSVKLRRMYLSRDGFFTGEGFLARAVRNGWGGNGSKSHGHADSEIDTRLINSGGCILSRRPRLVCNTIN